MSSLPPFILAADHRVPFVGRDPAKVGQFKQLLVRALARVRAGDPRARAGSGMLLDPIFGAGAIALAREEGIPVGQPLEVAGQMPLAWNKGGPEAVAAAGVAFGKVLIRVPEQDGESHLVHGAKLVDAALEVFDTANRPLVVELVFEGEADPVAASARAIERWAGKRVPTRWKLYGTGDATTLDRLVSVAPPGSEFHILGAGEPLETLGRWFTALRGKSAFKGFAIGRSIFWECFEGWSRGALDEEGAISQVAERYRRVLALWP